MSIKDIIVHLTPEAVSRPTGSIAYAINMADQLSAHACDRILVAWDYSRPAARAAADALPLLKMAKQVFVVTVTNDKEIKSSRTGVELARHFSRHGVEVTFEDVPRNSNSIDNTLLAHATARHVDLIVMGGYGHSQLREFVLGGATRGMLDNTDRPVIFSH